LRKFCAISSSIRTSCQNCTAIESQSHLDAFLLLQPAANMVQEPTVNAKPTIVIVPGSFSPASFYADLVDVLRSQGYDAMAETLQSSARSPLRQEKAATMEEDAEQFHAIAEKLADQGKDVVLVTHSYGGIPGTECSKGLSKKERKAAGKSGGISQIIYVTSLVPTPGHSLRDLMGDLVPAFINVEEVGPADLYRSRGFRKLTADTGRLHEPRCRRKCQIDVFGHAIGGSQRVGEKDAVPLLPQLLREAHTPWVQPHSDLVHRVREGRDPAARVPTQRDRGFRAREWAKGGCTQFEYGALSQCERAKGARRCCREGDCDSGIKLERLVA
jgi:pimeloyl-ACP methyl ester carboxylesterase